LVGPEAITASAGAFCATIKVLHHRVANEWHDGPDTIVEADVTYDRLDGKSVTIPVVSIWHVTRDGSLDAYRVFFDVAPIYSN